MTGNSKIEWTEQTWNPIVGCSIVSPGCTNCYAMKMAARIEAMGNQPRYAGTTKKVNGSAVWTGRLAQAPESVLFAPLKRKKPTSYFVNSMGDLFHEDVPDEWIDQVFAVMALCPQHTFQVLTKRAERMRDYLRGDRQNVVAWEPVARVMSAWHPHWKAEDITGPHRARAIAAGTTWPLPNVWLGVSAERQQETDERIPFLIETPAAVRFVSAEPLLGPIDLIGTFARYQDTPGRRPAVGLGKQLIDWVIVGGESGPGARPMHPDWARGLRDQCTSAGIAFFFKQWGEHGRVGDQAGLDHLPQDADLLTRCGKKAAGRLLDGVEHNTLPERGA